MINDILFALWFFLPAGVANVTPILAVKVPLLKAWNTPLDLGRSFKGKRLLGDHKTWRGIVSGVIMGTLFAGFQGYLFDQSVWVQSISQSVNYDSASILLLGFLLSLGALGGDALKSLLKRQLSVKSGESWFPFDQLDYIVGGLILSALVVQIPVINYLWILILWFGLHLLFSYIGYLLKLKDSPI
jgi:CDP-2,3-bis-(O-geranylgeranyl)-sn-glycerol synthase